MQLNRDTLCGRSENGAKVSEHTLYRWRSKYGGMQVSEARKLKGLEAENRKLKQLLADAHLDNAALKELLSKNW